MTFGTGGAAAPSHKVVPVMSSKLALALFTRALRALALAGAPALGWAQSGEDVCAQQAVQPLPGLAARMAARNLAAKNK